MPLDRIAMMKSLRIILLVLGLTIIGIEGILRLDPLGMIYYPELLTTFAQSEPIPAGWQMAVGVHNFTHWSATIMPDHTRLVPGTNPDGDETWVFLGDSVTFGYGVNDDAPFASQIAIIRPDIHVINAGTVGYDSANVRARAADFPTADRLIYLIYGNDAEPHAEMPHTDVQMPTSGINLYLSYWSRYQYLRYAAPRGDAYLATMDLPRFCDDVRTLDADPRVTMFIFEESVLQPEAQVCGTVLTLPSYLPQTVSALDDHPNPDGHRMIAQHILDAL